MKNNLSSQNVFIDGAESRKTAKLSGLSQANCPIIIYSMGLITEHGYLRALMLYEPRGWAGGGRGGSYRKSCKIFIA